MKINTVNIFRHGCRSASHFEYSFSSMAREALRKKANKIFQQCVKFQVRSMRSWDWPRMCESHAKCVRFDRSAIIPYNLTEVKGEKLKAYIACHLSANQGAKVSIVQCCNKEAVCYVLSCIQTSASSLGESSMTTTSCFSQTCCRLTVVKPPHIADPSLWNAVSSLLKSCILTQHLHFMCHLKSHVYSQYSALISYWASVGCDHKNTLYKLILIDWLTTEVAFALEFTRITNTINVDDDDINGSGLSRHRHSHRPWT